VGTLNEQWGQTIKEARMHDAVEELLTLLADKYSKGSGWDDSYMKGRDYILEFHNPRTFDTDTEAMAAVLDKFKIKNDFGFDMAPNGRDEIGKVEVELRSLSQHPLFKEMRQQIADKTYHFKDFERRL